MSDPTINMSGEATVKEELTVDEKLDRLGAQMNWLVENLSSLFVFAQQLGNNGGGIMGLLKGMKQGGPQLTPMEDNSDAD
jgi:hypothetical protein